MLAKIKNFQKGLGLCGRLAEDLLLFSLFQLFFDLVLHSSFSFTSIFIFAILGLLVIAATKLKLSSGKAFFFYFCGFFTLWMSYIFLTGRHHDGPKVVLYLAFSMILALSCLAFSETSRVKQHSK